MIYNLVLNNKEISRKIIGIYESIYNKCEDILNSQKLLPIRKIHSKICHIGGAGAAVIECVRTAI